MISMNLLIELFDTSAHWIPVGNRFYQTFIIRSQRLPIGPLTIGNGFFDITVLECRIISKPTDRVTFLIREELW
jgi:hypothetical protein